MKLTSESFSDGQRIPGRLAFGVPDTESHMAFGGNRSPQLSWSELPDNTRSLVLICTDPDAPASADGVNQEDQVIARDRPRADFTHWVMVDIDPSIGSLDEGLCADGVVTGGKQAPPGPRGARQGQNDYTGFLAGNPELKGDYRGYDGPCPPWNDERIHHYHFVLYATDLDRCPVNDEFTAADVLAAIDGHVLAEARLVGSYSLNPSLS